MKNKVIHFPRTSGTKIGTGMRTSKDDKLFGLLDGVMSNNATSYDVIIKNEKKLTHYLDGDSNTV